jgi:putative NIF3 family GTP cyclohydrolase 1 type 2
MNITVNDVIKELAKPVGKIENTVDGLKFGNPDAIVTGIVTTFMATQQVLETAHSMGANLIITHEGTCFSHHDYFEINIKNDPVWQEKLKFIQDSQINLYRLHDDCHRYEPDLITEGLIRALDWQSYISKQEPTYTVVDLPVQSLKEIADHIKNKLNLPYVRMVGETSLNHHRIGVMVGYRGGGAHAIPLFEKEALDLVVYGEGPEWETPEYIRDAVFQGRKKALIAIGHLASEEPGMKALAERLGILFPNVPIQFISETHLFQLV